MNVLPKENVAKLPMEWMTPSLGNLVQLILVPSITRLRKRAQVAQEKDCNNHLLPKIKMTSINHFDLRKLCM